MIQRLSLVVLFCIANHSIVAQKKATISGTIKDARNGESMIGASIFIPELKDGTTSNSYGFYSVSVPPSIYTLEISVIGYQKQVLKVSLQRDTTINLSLVEEQTVLHEVVVSARAEESSNNVRSMEMSTNHLDIKTIRRLPALLGETDVVKSLQFLPGVSQVGEGSSGFNVRGGSTGQNLILLDEAPIYNSSHLLGFFSTFNPDAVKEVKLYKGAIPANYGGRTSSVLDVRMKDGNMKQFEANGGIGVIFSRLSLEAPIVKDKASFIIGARRSYIDVIAKPVTSGSTLNFYDVTGKLNYKINDKNRLYVSAYLGRDNFGFSNQASFSWGNTATTVRWNSVLTNKLFANLSMVYSNYDYSLNINRDANNGFLRKSSITNYLAKPDFTWYMNSKSELSFGAEAISYQFNPGTATSVTNGTTIDNSLEKQHAIETASYISHKFDLTNRLGVEYGVRLSNFNYMGAGTAYTYNDTVPGARRSVVSNKYYGSGQVIKSYVIPEPRFSVKFQLNNQSALKASYTRNAQYIHFISNTTASNPLNIWTPSTNNLKPTIGNQSTIGYFRNFPGKSNYSFSVEGFYKSSSNEVDYINGADLLNNQYLEGDLLMGNGRAYGLEWFLQKQTGRLTGWISYTLSRSELKVQGINNGQWYPSRFDQPHNLKIVGMYEINKRWSFTADFVYTSGTPTTFPDQRYVSQGILIPYNSQNARNSTRIGPYDRLDVAFTLNGRTITKSGKPRKNKDYWVFSLYNVYARKNPYSIYFVQSDNYSVPGTPIQADAHQVSIIGTIIPSISYNFKF